ncbi:MAG: MarR family transcriptional regulator [Acidobacteria bacterium]|jgi:DNA-binding MarR family transcriptional regulator|nr:MAG: MarR family transcriptional regulator [Acidobacteriota bacterium]GIU81710.1 MAG: hypothetical protein KatS3mg006_0774 [Pyrinomonadaceae bacterium]
MTSFNPEHRNRLSGQITIAFYRIAQAIERLFRERGKSAHLSSAQIQSLIFLKYARSGVRTIGGLAERLGVTYATSSGVADALERKDLIRRIPSAEDKRIIELELTQKGKGEIEKLEDVLDEIESAIESLPTSEKMVLLKATQTIVRRLQKAGYVNVYEMCWKCQFFRPNAHPDNPKTPHHCAFMDAPLSEPETYLECPDSTPIETGK